MPTDIPTRTRLENKTSKKHWFKRLLFAILAPFVLFLLAGFLFNWIGEDGAKSIDSTLDELWWPATLLRGLTYLALSLAVFPYLVKQAVDTNQHYIDELNQAKAKAKAYNEEEAYLVNELKHAYAKAQALAKLRQQGYLILLLLILVDVILVQLPFWLKP